MLVNKLQLLRLQQPTSDGRLAGLALPEVTSLMASFGQLGGSETAACECTAARHSAQSIPRAGEAPC